MNGRDVIQGIKKTGCVAVTDDQDRFIKVSLTNVVVTDDEAGS